MHLISSLFFVALLVTSSIAHGQTSSSTASEVYRIDAESSDIRLLIYSAGPLARFGHNHVVSVARLEGTVRLHPNPEQSSMEVEIPVDQLIVDDPVLRSEEGDEFSSELSETDIDRTRANMLGPRLLNAEQYPTITIRGRGLAVEEQDATLNLSVELVGQVIERLVPVVLQLQGDELKVSGKLSLSHGELGLTPFSAMLGALRVADEMDLKFRVRARRVRD